MKDYVLRTYYREENDSLILVGVLKKSELRETSYLATLMNSGSS